MNSNVLQLLPRAPGTFDGVGDYALELARGLRDRYGIDSIFVAHDTQSKTELDSFSIFPLHEFSRARLSREKCDGIILHYVNYGFQKRGVPLTLASLLKTLRQDCGAALLVIFHEVYASGPPWRSEFWLRRLQKKIARDLARLADARLVSCESMRDELEKLSGEGTVRVHPVVSTWGEPALKEPQIRERDPHHWLICGGTALSERSLRSFLKIADQFSPEIAPHRLVIIGGAPNPHIRALLNVPAQFETEYFPAISRDDAAPHLSTAAFAWIDYFDRPGVSPDVLLKSSTFLSLCAYGLASVTPETSNLITLAGDALPVPFGLRKMPAPLERASAAVETYRWYHRHASGASLHKMIAQQLRLA